MIARDRLAVEVAEEFAAFSGAREFFDGDGYSFRRLGRLDDAEFDALTAKLRSAKWKREHPEECRRHKAESLARLWESDRDGQRAMRQRRKKKWQAKNRDKVRAMGRRAHERRRSDPAYCAAAVVRAQASYARAKADPAKAEALRAYKREWWRRKKALGVKP